MDRFTLIPRQHYDTVGVTSFLGLADCRGILADGAFDVHWVVDFICAQGACVVIPQRRNRLDRPCSMEPCSKRAISLP